MNINKPEKTLKFSAEDVEKILGFYVGVNGVQITSPLEWEVEDRLDKDGKIVETRLKSVSFRAIDNGGNWLEISVLI